MVVSSSGFVIFALVSTFILAKIKNTKSKGSFCSFVFLFNYPLETIP